MDKERIIEFNRKIVNSNPSELICVYYEMYFVYTQDAKAARIDDDAAYVTSLRKASQVVEQLRVALDFSYDLAKQLYPLYTFVEEALARAMYKRDEGEIDDADRIMRPLQESFIEVAKQDDRPPMMSNTQNVTTGWTYGRGQLMDSIAEDASNRGFWA